MRWVLPGGAVLNAEQRADNKLAVACRPGDAVLVSVRPPRPETLLERLLHAVKLLVSRYSSKEGLHTVKLWLEVLGLLVGLIATILALFGLSSRK